MDTDPVLSKNAFKIVILKHRTLDDCYMVIKLMLVLLVFSIGKRVKGRSSLNILCWDQAENKQLIYLKDYVVLRVLRVVEKNCAIAEQYLKPYAVTKA